MTGKSMQHVARISTNIRASKEQVWEALVDPESISRYMFGTKVVTDWASGSEITWEGEWEGKPYQDKGVILEVRPEQLLQYSHFSPLSGEDDAPENYHTVTIELSDHGTGTTVTLSQDNNASAEARDHSQENWQVMLDGLKELVENPT